METYLGIYLEDANEKTAYLQKNNCRSDSHRLSYISGTQWRGCSGSIAFVVAAIAGANASQRIFEKKEEESPFTETGGE